MSLVSPIIITVPYCPNAIAAHISLAPGVLTAIYASDSQIKSWKIDDTESLKSLPSWQFVLKLGTQHKTL